MSRMVGIQWEFNKSLHPNFPKEISRRSGISCSGSHKCVTDAIYQNVYHILHLWGKLTCIWILNPHLLSDLKSFLSPESSTFQAPRTRAQKTPKSVGPIHSHFTVKKESGNDKELKRDINEQLRKKEYELTIKILDHTKNHANFNLAMFLQLTYNSSMLWII